MEISYLGHSSFKIKTKLATVVTDPYNSSKVGLKFPKTEAEIVTVSHDHEDHNSVSNIDGTKKIVNGAGEYEIMGVSVLGFNSYHDDKKGEVRGKNVIYVFEAEGLRIAHLGDLGHKLSPELVDDMGSIDILMIPVGGVYTIDSKVAADIISEIEPYFVIPMHYKVDKLALSQADNMETLEPFLKEVTFPTETLPKLVIKKGDIIEDQNTKIIILEAR